MQEFDSFILESGTVFSDNQYMYNICMWTFRYNLKSWFKLIKFQNTRLWSSSTQHSFRWEVFKRMRLLGSTLYISSSGGDKLWRLHDLVRTKSMIFFPVKLSIICAVHGGTGWYSLLLSSGDGKFNWKPLLSCSILDRTVDSVCSMIERSVSKLYFMINK